MALFKDIEQHIQILTVHHEILTTRWKSYMQFQIPGGQPVIMFGQDATQKSSIESLEVLVVSLSKAVEEKEMAELRSAMEAREKAFED